MQVGDLLSVQYPEYPDKGLSVSISCLSEVCRHWDYKHEINISHSITRGPQKGLTEVLTSISIFLHLRPKYLCDLRKSSCEGKIMSRHVALVKRSLCIASLPGQLDCSSQHPLQLGLVM